MSSISPLIGVNVVKSNTRDGEPPQNKKRGVAQIVEKFKQMEEEMDKFEAEISGPLKSLNEKSAGSGSGSIGPRALPPPPPPPPMFMPPQLNRPTGMTRPPQPMARPPQSWPRPEVRPFPPPGRLPPPPPRLQAPPAPPAGIMNFANSKPAAPVIAKPSTVKTNKVSYASKPVLVKKPVLNKVALATLEATKGKAVDKKVAKIAKRIQKEEIKSIEQKNINRLIAKDMEAHEAKTLKVQRHKRQEEVERRRAHKKPKKIVRTAGGEVWEDNSLLEWDHDDFRIFCGDLGNDVTDEVLCRTFGRYPSFLKAKVVRDRRTGKSKGFGFLSFKDPSDFTRAMKDWNGKYVGSRPIKLRKSSWKERNIGIVKKKQQEKASLGLL